MSIVVDASVSYKYLRRLGVHTAFSFLQELSRGIVTLNNARKIKDRHVLTYCPTVPSKARPCVTGYSFPVSLRADAGVHAA